MEILVGSTCKKKKKLFQITSAVQLYSLDCIRLSFGTGSSVIIETNEHFYDMARL